MLRAAQYSREPWRITPCHCPHRPSIFLHSRAFHSTFGTIDISHDRSRLQFLSRPRRDAGSRARANPARDARSAGRRHVGARDQPSQQGVRRASWPRPKRSPASCSACRRTIGSSSCRGAHICSSRWSPMNFLPRLGQDGRLRDHRLVGQCGHQRGAEAGCDARRLGRQGAQLFAPSRMERTEVQSATRPTSISRRTRRSRASNSAASRTPAPCRLSATARPIFSRGRSR